MLVAIPGFTILILSKYPTSTRVYTPPKCYRQRFSRLNRGNYAMKARRISESMVSYRFARTLQSQMFVTLDSNDADSHKQFEHPFSTTSHSSATPFVGLPSYRRIMLFVATTFMIWVSEPLLSLVDSAAVGRCAKNSISSTPGTPDLSSVIQLAALGPATMMCDSSMYLTMFISMATTNKLARAFAERDLKEQIETLSHVMGVSLAVGTLLVLFINFQGERLLAAIIGPAGALVSVETARGALKSVDLTPEVLRASMGYSRIRSAVYPLAIMGLTSQAALLCAQDTKTPALAVLVASVVNIAGDYVFVAKMRWGVRGAALATSIASLLANGMLVGKAWGMNAGWKDACREKILGKESGHQMQRLASNANRSENMTTKQFGTPFISFPNRKALVSLLRLAGPMFFVMLGKIMGYSSMTVRAGNFGMMSLACHNVLMRIFFLFGTVGDAFSQSAQTFFPGLFYRKSLREKNAKDPNRSSPATLKNGNDDKNARALLKRLVVLSSAGGLMNCMLGRYIVHSSGGAFTTDSSLVSLMSRVSPFMGLALLLHPLTMSLEGSIIAASDSGYLVTTYVLSLIVLLGQLKLVCRDFLGVWRTMLLFQIIRITQFGARVWKKTSSSKNDKW